MDNHFHLLVETPAANLSETGQWLNVSYSVWFNRWHQRSGHLFQGRFGAVLVGDDADWLEVARYVHLNPVRVARLGLSKSDQQRQKTAAAQDPGARLVADRLRVLRSYCWSSYRAYVGLAVPPDWLTREVLLGASGGRTAGEQRWTFAAYHETPLREGGTAGTVVGPGSCGGGGRSFETITGTGRGAVSGAAAGPAEASRTGAVIGRGGLHGGGAGDPAGSPTDRPRQGLAAADRRGER